MGLKDGRIERLKLELERKDSEIQKLKAVVTQWEVCITYLVEEKNGGFIFAGLLYSFYSVARNRLHQVV